MSRISRIVAVILLSQAVTASPGWSVQAGERIPEFGVQSFAGNDMTSARLTGKPLLIVFWNTWCPNCQRELPRVNRLAEKFSPRGLAVLAINTGLNDSESKARAYWKKYGYRFPVGFDRNFEIVRSFRVVGVPTILLVDTEGIVRYQGSDLPENVEQRLSQLIGK